jgi:gas vesicle protein
MFRFLFGLILGAGVGVVAGAMLAPSDRPAREQAAAKEAGDLAPAAHSPWQAFRQRLAEAAQAGAEAAREMEEEMRARHKELVKRGKK